MALDAGYIGRNATLDLTGSNSVSLGYALTNEDTFEVGIEFVTASTTTAPVVKFYAQTTPLASTAPSSGEFAVVTCGDAANAAGVLVTKYVLSRIVKGSKIWAKVTTERRVRSCPSL